MKNPGLTKLCTEFVLCLLPWFPATQVFADADDPPGRVARLSYLQGNVSLQPPGENQWSQASTNYTVTTGDRLYTDRNSRAELETGPFAVRMSQTTDLTIASLNDRLMQLGLGEGSVEVTVFELPGENSVEIDTPNGALTLLRPGSYRVDSDPSNGSTLVIVSSGSLEVTGGGVSQAVQGGRAVQLTGTGPIQVNFVSIPNRDDFDEWCAGRDRRVQSFASRRYVNPYIPGVEDLDSFGRWEVVGEYGPVWYPAGVAVGWVPYRYGRWAWVEPWGWTWVESEPWGFCPFHYGRWVFVGSAWGWVPGPVAVVPVYAPALVAFVGGPRLAVGVRIGGVGVQAWFPLGPREPFVPWYHHGGDYYRQVNVTNVSNVTNVTNITNITNVTNITYVNRNATTVVSSEDFRGGRPVGQRVIHVPPGQLERAEVIAHPEVVPSRTAAFGGRAPVRTPPVPMARVMAAPASSGAARGMPPNASAREERAPSPAGGPPGERGRANPPVITREAPPPGRRVYGGPPAARPTFINRNPLPERDVPFAAHQPALAAHPGRPLEPQQEENVRRGRSPGPMRDREVLPHPPLRSVERPSAPRQETRQSSPSSRPASRREKH